MNKIVIIGSINMDLVTVCEKAPRAGETIFGTEFFQIPGGKGANQAVAASKLKSDVTMLGKIGNDSFGRDLISSMENDGVKTKFIEKSTSPTGIAKIIVEKSGENRIIAVSGANFDVSNSYIDRHLEVIKNSDFVVTQLEIPLDTVEYTLKKAKEFDKITILNPAPANSLNKNIIENVDIIIPNETELEVITGVPTDNIENIKIAANKLLQMGVKKVIVTLGSKGSIYLDKNGFKLFDAYKVNAVDTTAAGDSFIGGLVTTLSKKLDNIDEAIEFATAVSAITVTKRGAQTSLPTLEEVNEFRRNTNEKK